MYCITIMIHKRNIYIDITFYFDQILVMAYLWCTIMYVLNFGQDKWRNINVTAIWGSRQKAKLALKKCLPAPKSDSNHLALTTVVQREEVLDTMPLAVSVGTLQLPSSKEQLSRFKIFLLNLNISTI